MSVYSENEFINFTNGPLKLQSKLPIIQGNIGYSPYVHTRIHINMYVERCAKGFYGPRWRLGNSNNRISLHENLLGAATGEFWLVVPFPGFSQLNGVVLFSRRADLKGLLYGFR